MQCETHASARKKVHKIADFSAVREAEKKIGKSARAETDFFPAQKRNAFVTFTLIVTIKYTKQWLECWFFFLFYLLRLHNAAGA